MRQHDTTKATNQDDQHDTVVVAEPEENRKEEPIAAEPRKRDELFEKIADVCGWELSNLTKSARGQLNKAAKELRDVGATADQVGGKAAAYKEKYPGIELTPTALIKHWAALYVRKVETKQSIWETYNPPERYYT
jgi:biotin operon repressor